MNTYHLAALPLDTTSMIILAMLILVLFGIKVLPNFMRGLGKGVDDFRNASEEFAKRLNRLSEDAYWNQYDAEDKAPKWKMHDPKAESSVAWKPQRPTIARRVRVCILPVL